MSTDLVQLHEMEPALLVEQARTLGVRDADSLERRDLVYAIAVAEAKADGTTLGRGVLEVHGEGFGFLRSPDTNYLPGSDDIYVSQSQIRRLPRAFLPMRRSPAQRGTAWAPGLPVS